jgi:hypothetical protein
MDAKPLRLAADTNLLLDLADRDEDVLDAVAVIEQRLPQAGWLVSPSVLGCDYFRRSFIEPRKCVT